MENLKTSFGKLKVDQNKKTKLIQNVFDNVTEQYDLMNDLVSFGSHRLWKKRFVSLMNIQPNENIIDIGSGTGDIVRLIDDNFSNVSITSIDLNLNMLKKAKQKSRFINNKINWLNCNAESLPFKNDLFDKYIISFCLRNVTLINNTLSEAFRILKPGGSFHCLEFSTPQTSVIKNLYYYYKKNIIPLIGERVAKNKKAYRYLEESIEQFPHQNILLAKLSELGFVNTSVINLFNGIVSIHKGYKI